MNQTFKQFVAEAFFSYFKIFGVLTEVYKNPSQSDFAKLFKKSNSSVRCIVLDNGKGDIYAWSDIEAQHDDIMEKIKELKNHNPVFIGILFLSPDKHKLKLTATNSNEIQKKYGVVVQNILSNKYLKYMRLTTT